jgi:hypothetical protein
MKVFFFLKEKAQFIQDALNFGARASTDVASAGWGALADRRVG